MKLSGGKADLIKESLGIFRAIMIMEQLHQVTITINGGYSKENEILYFYSKTTEASVILTEQAATIMFSAVFDLDLDDPDRYSTMLFLDAYRKIHLIHLFAKGCTIQVKEIGLEIDNEFCWTSDEKDKDFPYIISMLEGTHFDLCDKWRNEFIYDVVSQWPIVASEQNLMHCAVSAFLSGKTRVYLGDRLLDFWTAINSYYNYEAICFETTAAEAEGVDRENIPRAIQAYGSDAPCIALMLMMDFRFFSDKHIWQDNTLEEACLRALSLVASLDQEHLADIFEETAGNFQNEKKGAFVPDELYDVALQLKIPLHLFLLVYHPYYLRCELVHGSRSIPILCSYYDTHLQNYTVCCYYMERFLDSTIPEMFRMNDRVTEQERELLTCFMRARNRGREWFTPEDTQRFGIFPPDYRKCE